MNKLSARTEGEKSLIFERHTVIKVTYSEYDIRI